MTDQTLMDAVKDGDLAAVTRIIERDPSAVNRAHGAPSPIQEAAYRGKSDVAAFLASRTDPDIFEAIALGRADEVQTLIESDPGSASSISYDGWSPLHLAGFFGLGEIVNLLLKTRPDLETRSVNSMSNTPLHAAIAGKCDLSAVRALLDAGADPNAAGATGYTPFHLAASRGNRELAELLIDKGANERALIEDGRTAAQVATEHGKAEMAAWLESRLTDSF